MLEGVICCRRERCFFDDKKFTQDLGWNQRIGFQSHQYIQCFQWMGQALQINSAITELNKGFPSLFFGRVVYWYGLGTYFYRLVPVTLLPRPGRSRCFEATAVVTAPRKISTAVAPWSSSTAGGRIFLERPGWGMMHQWCGGCQEEETEETCFFMFIFI